MDIHDDCQMRPPEIGEAAYEALWTQKWGYLQKYGPTSRHQRRIIAHMLDSLSFDSVLDVGCGEGSLLAFLGDRYPGRRMAGLDVAGPAIELARRNFPAASYLAGDLGCLPKESQYDLVTSIDVLEHVEDDEGMLRGMASACQRYALCGTVQGRMREGEREIGHVRNYRRGELEEKMIRAGLTPIWVVEWGFPFYSPLFRSSVASTRGESLSYGAYGLGRRLLCHGLYTLYLLNSWRRGDKIFILAEKR
jgi:SAM-dependent methyltransferase